MTRIRFRFLIFFTCGVLLTLLLYRYDLLSSVWNLIILPFASGLLGIFSSKIKEFLANNLLNRIPAYRKLVDKLKENENNSFQFGSQRKMTIQERIEISVKEKCIEVINRENEIPLISERTWLHNPKIKKVKKYNGKLSSVFSETHKKRLNSFILIGNSGVGKTWAFHQHILELLNSETEESEEKIIPVYFELTSWSEEQSLIDWIQNVLWNYYKIEKKYTRSLLEDFKIMPFFDNLDQVQESSRKKLISEIRSYEISSGSVAISCRTKILDDLSSIYEDIENPIISIYQLMPFSTSLVKSLIEEFDNKNELNNVLHKSESLKTFVRYPMALNLLSSLSKNLLKENEISLFDEKSDEDIFKELWDRYDKEIIEDELLLNKYSIYKIRYWLRKISLFGGNYFLVEKLQPVFLENSLDRFWYFLISRILCSLALMVAVGLFLAGPFQYIEVGIISGITITTIHYIDIFLRNRGYLPNLFFRNILIRNYFLYGLPIVIIHSLYFGFSTPRYEKEMIFYGTFALTQINLGVFTSIFFTLIFGGRESWQKVELDINPVERISKNWEKILISGVKAGVFYGVFFLVLYHAIVNFLKETAFIDWIKGGMYNSESLALIQGLVCGFILYGIVSLKREYQSPKSKESYHNSKVQINFGISKSIENSLIAFLMVSIFAVLLITMCIGVETSWNLTNLLKASKTGFAFGLIAALWLGGLDVIQHYTLRLIIYFRNYGPWNYSDFLKLVSSLRLIYRSGGGYVFIHPSLNTYLNDHTNYNRDLIRNENQNFKIFSLITISLIGLTFWLNNHNRFSDNYFWEDPFGFNFINIHSANIDTVGKNKLIFPILAKQEIIEISATGKSFVGDFTGFINSSGSEASFMGLNIGNVYDFNPTTTGQYPHAALLFKKTSSTTWNHFPKNNFLALFTNVRKKRVKINKGDTLEFLVNDSEYHNNFGGYNISIYSSKDYETKIISNMGAAGLAPENTLISIEKTLQYDPEIIKIDIRQTIDGKLVLMQDRTIDNTTNGKGEISDITWNELQHYNINDDAYSNIKISDLESVLDFINDKEVKLLIELKDPDKYKNIANNLVNTIEKKDMVENVFIYSTDDDFIFKLKKRYPKFRVGVFSIGDLKDDEIHMLDFITFSPLQLIIKPSLIKKYQNKGLHVFVQTTDKIYEMQYFINQKVDGIITNYPNILKKELNIL